MERGQDNEVKQLGDALVRGVAPDSAESDIARFWPGGGSNWNLTTRGIVAGRGLDLWQRAWSPRRIRIIPARCRRPEARAPEVLRRFFGTDDIAFVRTFNAGAVPLPPPLPSLPAKTITRNIEPLSEAASESADARVFAGIHFPMAHIERTEGRPSMSECYHRLPRARHANVSRLVALGADVHQPRRTAHGAARRDRGRGPRYAGTSNGVRTQCSGGADS